MKLKRHRVMTAAVCGGVVMLAAACSSPRTGMGEHMKVYREALHETAPERMVLMEPGSETETRALRAFKDQFADFSADHLRGIGGLYTDDAYFNDTLVTLRGGEAIETYFLRTAEAVEECTFDIEDVAVSGGDYYVRWTMTMRMKRYRDRPPNVSTGMTHLRFDPDGRIVFHQDYWDTANLYRELPVLGGLIRWVNRRIEG